MSRPRLINFTAGEARALLHRAESWDCIVQVFEETDGLEVYAEATPRRLAEMVETLKTREPFVCINSEEVDPFMWNLDREILCEVVAGSTWPAIHHPDNDTRNTRQAYNGAVRCLWNAWEKIALAFGLAPSDIDFPQA